MSRHRFQFRPLALLFVTIQFCLLAACNSQNSQKASPVAGEWIGSFDDRPVSLLLDDLGHVFAEFRPGTQQGPVMDGTYEFNSQDHAIKLRFTGGTIAIEGRLMNDDALILKTGIAAGDKSGKPTVPVRFSRKPKP